jgi:hypothetical protein
MSDALEVAARLRDRATVPGVRQYWQSVLDMSARDRTLWECIDGKWQRKGQ